MVSGIGKLIADPSPLAPDIPTFKAQGGFRCQRPGRRARRPVVL